MTNCLRTVLHLNTRSFSLFKIEAARSEKNTPNFIVYANSAAVQSFYTDNRDEITAAHLQFSADICRMVHTALPKAKVYAHKYTPHHTHTVSNLIVPEN